MTEGGFSAALERDRLRRRLGDVRLRYDAELLIGECVPPLDLSALLPDALLVAGLAAGVAAAATLVVPQLRAGGVWGTLGATAASAAATIASLRMRGLRRGRRGFVVNFDQHVVRVDAPRGLLPWSATTLVPFGEVDEVQWLDRAAGRSALALVSSGRSFVLFDAVEPRDREQLQRMQRVLEAAFARDVTPPAGA